LRVCTLCGEKRKENRNWKRQIGRREIGGKTSFKKNDSNVIQKLLILRLYNRHEKSDVMLAYDMLYI
jgi:hypothetical protein